LSDPLNGAAATGVADAQGLVTSDYVPVLVGATVFGIVLTIGFRWLRTSVRSAGGR